MAQNIYDNPDFFGSSWKTVEVFRAIDNLTPIRTVFGGQIAGSQSTGSAGLLDRVSS